MLQFTTENSIYLVDTVIDRYMRLNKEEAPRVGEALERQKESWRLEDNKWIELRDWQVEGSGDEFRLRLYTPDAVHGVLTSLITEVKLLPPV